MKNISKIGLLALVIAASFTACTKDNNSVAPAKATGTATLNKANASSVTLAKIDTITPIKAIIPLLRRDTITPIKIIIATPLLRRDTITPDR